MHVFIYNMYVQSTEPARLSALPAVDITEPAPLPFPADPARGLPGWPWCPTESPGRPSHGCCLCDTGEDEKQYPAAGRTSCPSSWLTAAGNPSVLRCHTLSKENTIQKQQDHRALLDTSTEKSFDF